MAVYTDGIHMVSDFSIDELHTFAENIGLKRHWFEGSKKRHPHYDLVNKKKAPIVCKKTGKKFIDKAIENGAVVVKLRKIAQICKELYGNFPQKKSFKDINNKEDENNQIPIDFSA